MDAEKALAAIVAGDMNALVDAIEWDERFDFDLPNGVHSVIGYRGQTIVVIDVDGDVMLAGHPDHGHAVADCVRQKAAQATAALASHWAMVRFFETRQAMAGLQVPDDASALIPPDAAS